MKRGSGFYDGIPSKKVKPANEEIRILIQSRVAGSIIGKGGQNISKLRNDYKASITVPDCPGPERILTITADEECMMSVVSEIIPYLEEKRRGSNIVEKTELRVLIHQSQVGAVIGKGGARIKELREETGANVKIYSACCPESTDRVMQISGNSDVCIECLKHIINTLKDSELKGPYQSYDPYNFDEEFAVEYGGYGDGSRAGGHPPPWADQWMGRGSMNGAGFGGRGRGFGPGPRGRTMDDGYGGGMSRGPPGRFGPDDYMGRGGRGGSEYELGFKEFQSEDDGWGEKKSQVTIPQNLAGAIIGKGGSRIRNIRSESGANIVIEDPSGGSTDRIITITGPPRSIEMAQYLLQQSVREHGGRY